MSPSESTTAAWVLFAVQIVTLVALIVYVWKTWEMASATRRAAEASARAVQDATDARLEALAPRILVYFGSDELQYAEVVVENRGQGTATDLQVTFDPPLKGSHDSAFDANKFFESAKPLFPPGYRVVHSFDMWHSYLASDSPRRYQVRTTYRGKENGREYSEVYVLDVSAMAHRVEFDRKTMDDLVRELEKLAKAVETGFRQFQASLDLNTATRTYSRLPRARTREMISDLVAAWDAVNIVDAFAPSRFWREPLLIHLRSVVFQAYEAARRENAPPELVVRIGTAAQLIFVPHGVTDEEWEAKLKAAIDSLRADTTREASSAPA